MPSLIRSGKIRRLELENFKSYEGLQTTGPFYDFTAIIGPNGAGKSNPMDAISFVLVVGPEHLRGAQLKDLIYAFDDREKEQKGRKAFVKLVYQMGNGSEIEFMRMIMGSSGSEYRIDGSVVSWDEYNGKLESIGILVKARNFLVFQTTIQEKLSELEGEKEIVKKEIACLKPELQKLKSSIDERTEGIQKLEKRLNEIAERIFKDFSQSVGVKNIREHEENKLKAAQDIYERKLNLSNQISKLGYEELAGKPG